MLCRRRWALCVRRRQPIPHHQTRRAARLRRAPTGCVWFSACSWSSVSFMDRRLSSGAIVGREGSHWPAGRGGDCRGRVVSSAWATEGSVSTTWAWTASCKWHGRRRRGRVAPAADRFSVRAGAWDDASPYPGWIRLGTVRASRHCRRGALSRLSLRSRASRQDVLASLSPVDARLSALTWRCSSRCRGPSPSRPFPRGRHQLPAGISLRTWRRHNRSSLHFVIQATAKVVVFAHGAESFALAWVAASALVPLLIFIVKAPSPDYS